MKPKQAIRLCVDVVMTLCLLFLMGYQLWGELAHEWVGAGMFLLFIVHHVLNRKWYSSLLRGRYGPVRVLQTVIDILTFAAMLALMVSGLILSRHVFSFLPFKSFLGAARKLHILGSHWGLLLMGLHLGLHWSMITSAAKKKFVLPIPPRLRAALCWLAGFLVALRGGIVFFQRGFPTAMFLQTEFLFLDYEEPILFFYLDYFCLLGLFIFLGCVTVHSLKTPTHYPDQN